MTKLTETFRTPEARVSRTIVAVDLANSTKMKEDKTEADWLNTYGWFFDLLRSDITTFQGKVIKYLGDGLMAEFPEERAADAINYAIGIQEQIATARADRLVDCSCSIGMSCGELVQFDSDGCGIDYIGSVADRAFRLCSAANANAIFVDSDTVAAATMTRVRSKAGVVIATKRRIASEYQGPEESIRLKGFMKPVKYYEILWENTRFSVRPSFATELSGKHTPQQDAPSTRRSIVSASARDNSERTQWTRGRVKTVNENYGFLTGPEDEDFWFNHDHLFSSALQPRIGEAVWFIQADPYGESKNRRATHVLPFGSILDGELKKVLPDGYGFAVCVDDAGDTYDIFISLGDAGEWSQGDTIEFEVGSNPRGLAGINPTHLDSLNQD